MNFFFLVAMVLAFGVEPTPLMAPARVPLRLLAVFACVAFIVALASWIAYSAAERIAKDYEQRERTLNRYHRWQLVHSILGIVTFGAAVLHFGWSSIVRLEWGLGSYFLVDDLLVLAPYLLSEVLSFVFFYRVDLEVRRQGILRGKPARAPWSLAGYLNFQIRNQLGIWLLASLLIMSLRDAFLWMFPDSDESPTLAVLSMGLTSLSVMALSPVIIRWVWQAIPLPPGPLRQRLEFLCAKTGFRCSNILIWQTNRGIANAAVTGVVPQLRYVFLSDGLIDQLTPDELVAVFGHEVGHIRHWHMTYYFGFLVSSVVVFALATPHLTDAVQAVVSSDIWIWLQYTWAYVPFEFWLLVPYFLIVFGYLSRRFERQADIYGSRSVSEVLRHERGLEQTFEAEPMVEPVRRERDIKVTPMGVSIFISALDRVCESNGMTKKLWSWRHGSIAHRIEFLEKIATDPGLADRYDRSVLVLRWAVVLGIGLAITVFSYLPESLF